MSDSKYQYSRNASKIKRIAKSNKALSKKTTSGEKRAAKYKHSWNSVDINEVVNKFTPNASVYESNGKIIFSNGGRYLIIADAAGGYLKIQDLHFKGTVYVTIDGKYEKDFPNKSEWNKHCHYRICKRGEINK